MSSCLIMFWHLWDENILKMLGMYLFTSTCYFYIQWLATINNYNSHVYDLFKKFNTVSVILTTYMECILLPVRYTLSN